MDEARHVIRLERNVEVLESATDLSSRKSRMTPAVMMIPFPMLSPRWLYWFVVLLLLASSVCFVLIILFGKNNDDYSLKEEFE
jgi:hypothetical protein